MHWLKPPGRLSQPPLRVLWLPTLDTPITPMAIRTLRRGEEYTVASVEKLPTEI